MQLSVHVVILLSSYWLIMNLKRWNKYAKNWYSIDSRKPLSYCLNYQSVFIQTPRSTLINLTLENYSNNYYAFKEIEVND